MNVEHVDVEISTSDWFMLIIIFLFFHRRAHRHMHACMHTYIENIIIDHHAMHWGLCSAKNIIIIIVERRRCRSSWRMLKLIHLGRWETIHYIDQINAYYMTHVFNNHHNCLPNSPNSVDILMRQRCLCFQSIFNIHTASRGIDTSNLKEAILFLLIIISSLCVPQLLSLILRALTFQ